MASPAKRAESVATSKVEKKKRLTFNETKELAALPDRIDALELERTDVYASLADPAFTRDGSALQQATSRLAALDKEINTLTERWEALENIVAQR